MIPRKTKRERTRGEPENKPDGLSPTMARMKRAKKDERGEENQREKESEREKQR